MERRTASHHDDFRDSVQELPLPSLLVECHATVLHPAPQRVPHGRGLLEDLLEHEVLEAAALGCLHVPINLDALRLYLRSVEAEHPEPAGAHLGDLVVA
jgi:hypothetical protein